MRGLFITGTDTGVGKTILSAALVAAMVGAGEPVSAYKPAVTGIGEPPGAWPQDHELLAEMAGMTPQEVAPLRYSPAVSPHLAAAMAGEPIDPTQMIEHARTLARRGTLIVEGVGGLLVPLAEDFTIRDLAAALSLPLLIAARPGLGTINHTLLTLQAARAVGLRVRAVVLTPWPRQPSAMEQSNRDTIAHIGQIETKGLTPVTSPTRAEPTREELTRAEAEPTREEPRSTREEPRSTRAELAQAGAMLPWKQWLTPESCIASRT